MQEYVQNVKDPLENQELRIYVWASTPLLPSYRFELDATPDLSLAYSSYFQSLIVIIIWYVDMGFIDITCEVSMMSSHISIPR